ncbi:unnamed protein product, partial [Allacma fusca]
MVEMRKEYARLESFFGLKGWSKSYISPLALARTGFRYLGEDDKVQCVYCGVTLQNWKIGDDPWKEHR